MQKSIKSRAAALALAATMTLTLVSAPSIKVDAASKVTVPVVVEESSNGNGTTKYSYNKKGLISKAVYSNSYKTDGHGAADYKNKSTTTYKYNKKNLIASRSTKSEFTTTSYTTDKYGEIRADKTPITSVSKSSGNTVYTYDKKGRVKQTVYTGYDFNVENFTNTDTSVYEVWIPGTYVNGEYVSGKDVDSTQTTTTSVSTTDGGNGTYTRVTSETVTTPYYDSATATIAFRTSVDTTTETITSQDVTTTTYTSDKKGRVKSASSETVSTKSVTTHRERTTNYGTADADTQVWDETENTTSKSATTDKYTYNKKGKATKIVTNSQPDVSTVTSSTNKHTYNDIEEQRVQVGTDEDGYPKYDYQVVKTLRTDASSSQTTIEGGVKTVSSSTPNSDGSVSQTVKTTSYPANTMAFTTTYKYDKKGNVASVKSTTVDTNNREHTYEVKADGSQGDIVYNNLVNPLTGQVLTNEDGTPRKDYDSPVYTTKIKTTKATSKVEGELKANTNRLTKAISMYNSVTGREVNKAYSTSRTTYKLKNKKLAKNVAARANQQQWILQNGRLNGQFGL